MVELNGPSRPKTADGKGKRDTYEKAYTLYEGRELILYVFISGIFPLKERHRRLKILTPKQMLQRSPIAIAQVKASNTSENLLNAIRQIIHSLHLAKEITKKYITI